MDGIIVLVYFVILFLIFRKVVKRSNAGGTALKSNSKVSSTVTTRTNASVTRDNRNNNLAVSNNNVTFKSGSLERGMADDYANDWLTRQRQEEHKAYKAIREVFDLKIEHARDCDADMIKKFHEAHCESGHVDTGEKRK